MAIVIAQARFTTPTGVMVNTFNFNNGVSDYPTHAADCAAAITSFYTGPPGSSFGAFMANWVTRQFEIRCYNRNDPKPREPIITGANLPTCVSLPANTHNFVPLDTAICLSYNAAAPVTRRKRGRIYIGGLTSDWINAGDVARAPAFTFAANTPCAYLVAAANTLRQSPVGWVIHSTAAGADYPIVGGHIDDEPDTQRRRGNQGAPGRSKFGTDA